MNPFWVLAADDQLLALVEEYLTFTYLLQHPKSARTRCSIGCGNYLLLSCRMPQQAN